MTKTDIPSLVDYILGQVQQLINSDLPNTSEIEGVFSDFPNEDFRATAEEYQENHQTLREQISEHHRIDSVFAKGLKDGNINRQLDQLGGTLHSVHKVLQAGADRFKVVERLEHGAEETAEAIERLRKLITYVSTDIDKVGDKTVRSQSEEFQKSADQLETHLVDFEEKLRLAGYRID